MAEERKSPSRHRVIIDERELIAITGVLDVISFDEENIVAETDIGVIVLKGTNFHVNKLNLDNGELEVDGQIDSLTYEDNSAYSKNKASLFSKIFK